MDMEMIDLGELVQVIKGRYWTALAVNVLSFCIPSLLVAVKSAFIQITEDQGGWGITVNTRIGYIIIVLYSALCARSVAVLVELRGKHTGLKWSPCSLAAQLALVHSSNIFPAFEGMELCTRGMVRGRTRSWWRTFGYLRIGYWRKTHAGGNAGSELLFHGIRFVCTDRLHAQAESVRVNARHRNDRTRGLSMRGYSLATNLYAESEAPVTFLTDCQREASYLDWVWRKPLGFHRYPWSGRGPAIFWFWSGGTVFLSDIYIAVMMLLTFLSLVGLATFLATGIILKPKSYANSSILGSQGTRNVILNSSPAFLLSLVNIVFVMSDTYHRTLQPVRGMDQPSTAQQNLLVDYLSPAPFNVIIAATSNGHYRVAWCSFLALIASTGPAIAGGMFTVDSASKTFRATPSSAYLVLGVLCAYVIAIPMARPSAKFAAGRGLWNIIDTVFFCYDSPILEHPEFSVQGKSDEEIHLKSQVIAARRHYQFGYYLGLSGRRRLGFAEAKTEPHSSTGPNSSVGQGTNVIVHGVDRVKSRYGFLRFNVSWFRDPEVIRSDRSSDIEMDVGNISQSGERNDDADGSGI